MRALKLRPSHKKLKNLERNARTSQWKQTFRTFLFGKIKLDSLLSFGETDIKLQWLGSETLISQLYEYRGNSLVVLSNLNQSFQAERGKILLFWFLMVSARNLYTFSRGSWLTSCKIGIILNISSRWAFIHDRWKSKFLIHCFIIYEIFFLLFFLTDFCKYLRVCCLRKSGHVYNLQQVQLVVSGRSLSGAVTFKSWNDSWQFLVHVFTKNSRKKP